MHTNLIARQNKYLDTIYYPSTIEYTNRIIKSVNELNSRLRIQGQKYLDKVTRKEKILLNKIGNIDSVTAINLRSQINRNIHGAGFQNIQTYIPGLDSLETSIQFLLDLQNGKELAKSDLHTIQTAIYSIQDLKNQLGKADQVTSWINHRKSIINSVINNKRFTKQIKSYNKKVFYYKQLITELKNDANDPRKAGRKLLNILSHQKEFKKYFQKNSQLASLFRMPGESTELKGISHLQTQYQLKSLLSEKINSGGPAATDFFQQKIADAKQQMQNWKTKVSHFSGNSSDLEMPDFKPNSQKTKPFLRRIELGTSIQNTGQNTFLPVTTDIAFLVGFKLNDKSIVGIGTSYKMGWGQGLRNLTITHQGIGLRTFLDWKIKGSFYLSGGYEKNYYQKFLNMEQLKQDKDNWQSSGLIGASKKYEFGKKKNGEIKILFDFLYKTHIPQTQPVLFRLGYGL